MGLRYDRVQSKVQSKGGEYQERIKSVKDVMRRPEKDHKTLSIICR